MDSMLMQAVESSVGSSDSADEGASTTSDSHSSAESGPTSPSTGKVEHAQAFPDQDQDQRQATVTSKVKGSPSTAPTPKLPTIAGKEHGTRLAERAALHAHDTQGSKAPSLLKLEGDLSTAESQGSLSVTSSGSPRGPGVGTPKHKKGRAARAMALVRGLIKRKKSRDAEHQAKLAMQHDAALRDQTQRAQSSAAKRRAALGLEPVPEEHAASPTPAKAGGMSTLMARIRMLHQAHVLHHAHSIKAMQAASVALDAVHKDDSVRHITTRATTGLASVKAQHEQDRTVWREKAAKQDALREAWEAERAAMLAEVPTKEQQGDGSDGNAADGRDPSEGATKPSPARTGTRRGGKKKTTKGKRKGRLVLGSARRRMKRLLARVQKRAASETPATTTAGAHADTFSSSSDQQTPQQDALSSPPQPTLRVEQHGASTSATESHSPHAVSAPHGDVASATHGSRHPSSSPLGPGRKPDVTIPTVAQALLQENPGDGSAPLPSGDDGSKESDFEQSSAPSGSAGTPSAEPRHLWSPYVAQRDATPSSMTSDDNATPSPTRQLVQLQLANVIRSPSDAAMQRRLRLARRDLVTGVSASRDQQHMSTSTLRDSQSTLWGSRQALLSVDGSDTTHSVASVAQPNSTDHGEPARATGDVSAHPPLPLPPPPAGEGFVDASGCASCTPSSMQAVCSRRAGLSPSPPQHHFQAPPSSHAPSAAHTARTKRDAGVVPLRLPVRVPSSSVCAAPASVDLPTPVTPASSTLPRMRGPVVGFGAGRLTLAQGIARAVAVQRGYDDGGADEPVFQLQRARVGSRGHPRDTGGAGPGQPGLATGQPSLATVSLEFNPPASASALASTETATQTEDKDNAEASRNLHGLKATMTGMEGAALQAGLFLDTDALHTCRSLSPYCLACQATVLQQQARAEFDALLQRHVASLEQGTGREQDVARDTPLRHGATGNTVKHSEQEPPPAPSLEHESAEKPEHEPPQAPSCEPTVAVTTAGGGISQHQPTNADQHSCNSTTTTEGPCSSSSTTTSAGSVSNGVSQSSSTSSTCLGTRSPGPAIQTSTPARTAGRAITSAPTPVWRPSKHVPTPLRLRMVKPQRRARTIANTRAEAQVPETQLDRQLGAVQETLRRARKVTRASTARRGDRAASTGSPRRPGTSHGVRALVLSPRAAAPPPRLRDNSVPWHALFAPVDPLRKPPISPRAPARCSPRRKHTAQVQTSPRRKRGAVPETLAATPRARVPTSPVSSSATTPARPRPPPPRPTGSSRPGHLASHRATSRPLPLMRPVTREVRPKAGLVRTPACARARTAGVRHRPHQEGPRWSSSATPMAVMTPLELQTFLHSRLGR